MKKLFVVIIGVSLVLVGLNRLGQRKGKVAEASSTLASEPARDPASVAPKSPEAVKAPTDPAMPLAPVTKTKVADLSSYVELKKKVLMNDEEKSQKKALLANTDMIGRAGSLLRGSQVSVRDSGPAIDFLIEALGTDAGHDAAAEQLRAIVSDARVEDATLASSVREQLAETKAEVLYRWTALEPKSFEDVSRLMPGPVSRKILANVSDVQNRNRNESRLVGLGDR